MYNEIEMKSIYIDHVNPQNHHYVKGTGEPKWKKITSQMRNHSVQQSHLSFSEFRNQIVAKNYK